jgi:hypothetical protein
MDIYEAWTPAQTQQGYVDTDKNCKIGKFNVIISVSVRDS